MFKKFKRYLNGIFVLSTLLLPKCSKHAVVINSIARNDILTLFYHFQISSKFYYD